MLLSLKNSVTNGCTNAYKCSRREMAAGRDCEDFGGAGQFFATLAVCQPAEMAVYAPVDLPRLRLLIVATLARAWERRAPCTRKFSTECVHTNPKRKRGNIIARPRLRFGLVWERE